MNRGTSTPSYLELSRPSNYILDASTASQSPQSSSYEDSLVEDIQLHLNLPPSSVACEVVVMLSPKKTPHESQATRALATPNSIPTHHSATSRTPPPKFEPSSHVPEGCANDVGCDLVARPAYIPVHLRYNTANLPNDKRFVVMPQMLKDRVSNLSSSAGKKRAWYVVIRGLEIGIFTCIIGKFLIRFRHNFR
jgi:hypothetical protein